jgi:hypothetical protein
MKLRGMLVRHLPPANRTWLCEATVLVLASGLVGCGSEESSQAASAATGVTINELQSRNSTISSDTGKTSDWAELYNSGDAEMNLDGYYISDNPDVPQKAKLPAQAQIPAKGFLVLWLDDTLDPSIPLHFPFKLSGSGEHFLLNTPNGIVVTKVDLPPDPTGTDTTAPDVSYSAYPDGSYTFRWCNTPTPGAPNAASCSVDGG